MGEYKYRAFISYSHVDEKWGRWLHRALEDYRVPRALRRRVTALGPVPQRLSPIFRDRADLPASGDLSAEIREALAASLFQIVVCSPNAARSAWVNEEIRQFKRLRGGSHTLALIVKGEPFASDMPGREAEECFPPALRFRVDEEGAVTTDRAEPIAADLRRGGDDRRHAISKLAAGLIGVKLDDLMQREEHRRARTARALALVWMAVAAGGVALWIDAETARDDAQRARADAEDLIEFMLGDLREKLVPVGRLDALEVVGERALEYYGSQDLEGLDPDSLGRRARALLLVGEIAQQRGDLDEALKAYEAAAATTEEELNRAPDDPKRIFEHAQSVFWVGYIAKERGDLTKAEAQFRQYLALAERLVALDPENPDWLLELAYASNGLGTVKLEARAFDQAREYFQRSIAIRKALLADSPDDRSAIFDLALAWSWLALVEFETGAFEAARRALAEELLLYNSVLAADPRNRRFQAQWIVAARMLSRVLLSQGLAEEGYVELLRSKPTVDELVALEPTDTTILSRAAAFYTDLATLQRLRGEIREARRAAQQALAFSRDQLRRDSRLVDWRTIHGLALIEGIKSSADDGTDAPLAAELEAFIQEPVATSDESFLSMSAAGWLVLGDGYADLAEAASRWERGVAALEPLAKGLRASSKLTLATLYLRLHRRFEALALVSELEELGYRHPEYLNMKEQLQLIIEK